VATEYKVEIKGEAAAEVSKAVETGASVGEVVSDALAARKWLTDNAKAGRLFIKDGSKFIEVTLKS
jgi:hypothetical protein